MIETKLVNIISFLLFFLMSEEEQFHVFPVFIFVLIWRHLHFFFKNKSFNKKPAHDYYKNN